MFSDVASTSSGGGATGDGKDRLTDEVMWEYRWKNEDTEDIHGPFTSSQMSQWNSEG